MRDAASKAGVQSRLGKIEGQMSGVRRMIAEDAYCVDVLHQVFAIQSALHQVSRIIIGQHIETCVKDVFEHGKPADRQAKIEELVALFAKGIGLSK